MSKAFGYAAKRSISRLRPFEFERPDPGPDDVAIEILYCGVCHSDIHQVENDWGNTLYPCLPGHEIVGRVTAVGDRVTKFAVGDLAGVGCFIDSCGECRGCREGLEQYCEGPKGVTATYNGPMKPDGSNTFGGYSDHIIVKESFVLRIPESLDLQAVAPLLCAGVTTYSPLIHWKISAGQRVAIVGLGGLGHIAVKIAKALGARVTVFTRQPEKKEDALRLGAEEVVISTDKKAMAKQELTFDYILSTIPEPHDINPFVKLLKRDGTMTIVGALAPLKPALDNTEMIMHRRQVAGSLVGGIAETQAMLDFCARHGITADVEVIPIDQINEAFQRVLKGDVRFRFVIDMSTLSKEASG